jgi:uncharacterized membrane protein
MGESWKGVEMTRQASGAFSRSSFCLSFGISFVYLYFGEGSNVMVVEDTQGACKIINFVLSLSPPL